MLLEAFDSPFLLDGAMPGSVTIAAGPLACADGATIWSQHGETYTQMVDIGDINQSVTIMAPGQSEDVASAIEAVAAGEITLTYEP